MKPNAFVEQDPKPILQKLAEYSLQKQMTCVYKKNSHKLKLQVPVGPDNFVDFWVIFERGRKKSTKGLYRLNFMIEGGPQSEKIGQATPDQEFLCTGFLHLIKNFALNCGNPV